MDGALGKGQAAAQAEDQDAVECLARRVGVQRAHGAVLARVHRLQHRHDLGPPDLADQDALRIVPERVRDQVMQRDGADAFGVRLPGLERDHVRVAGHVMQEQLVLGLQGGHPLTGRNLAGQAAQQGRLAGVHAAGDDDVVPAPDRRGQERGGGRVHGAELDELRQGDVEIAVPAQRHARPRRYRHGGGHPRAAGERHVHQRRAGREVPRGLAAAGRPVADHVDQRLVARGDWRRHHPLPGGVGHPHLIAAVDVDVLHGRVPQVAGQRPEAVPLVVDSLRQRLPVGRRRHRRAGWGERGSRSTGVR